MSFPLIPATLAATVAPAALELGKHVVEQLDFAHLFTQPDDNLSVESAASDSAFQPINGLQENAGEQIEQIRKLLKSIQDRLQRLTAGSSADNLEIRDNGFGELRVSADASARATIEQQLNQDDELKQAFHDLYRYAVQAEPEVLAQAGLVLQNPDRFAEVLVGDRATEPIDFSLSYKRGQLSVAHD